MISRIFKAEIGVILLFTWNYLSFILCTNYCLELFSFILRTKTKNWLLLVLQTIICKCDVIITEYQELFVDMTS